MWVIPAEGLSLVERIMKANSGTCDCPGKDKIEEQLSYWNSEFENIINGDFNDPEFYNVLKNYEEYMRCNLCLINRAIYADRLMTRVDFAIAS